MRRWVDDLLAEALGERHGGVLPASLWLISTVRSVTPSRARVNRACSRASAVVIELAARQPTIRPEKASTTKAT
jgi:hypothetical protein